MKTAVVVVDEEKHEKGGEGEGIRNVVVTLSEGGVKKTPWATPASC